MGYVTKRIIGTLCVMLSWRFALAADAIVIVREGRAKKTVRSEPHKPYMVINSFAQLQQHYRTMKSLVPSMPFIMEGKWCFRVRGTRCALFRRTRIPLTRISHPP